MFTIRKTTFLGILVAIFLIPTIGHAALYDFSNIGNYNGVGFGNLGNGTTEFIIGNEVISANAYSLVANNSANGFTNRFRNAQLTRNQNNGLGVNRGNDSSGQIDNQDNIDLILFDFGTSSANPIDIAFSLVNNNGNDNAALWLGNGLESLYADTNNNIDNFLDLNFTRLVSQAGFDLIETNVNLSLNNPYSFSGTEYRYLVAAAPDYRVVGASNDNFRISVLNVADAATIPEPGSVVLMLTGLLLMLPRKLKILQTQQQSFDFS